MIDISETETNKIVDKSIKSNELKEYLSNEIADNMIYKTFFNSLEVLDINDKDITLTFKEYSDNTKDIYVVAYKKVIDKAIAEIFGKDIKYKIISELEIKQPEIITEKEITKQVKTFFQNDYAEKSTFKNYLKSEFNKEAVDVCKTVAEFKSDFAILFMSGPSGIGKTHLLQAVGKAAEEVGKKSIYITPLVFNKKILGAIQENNTTYISKLLNHITSADIVLFDDFHIFAEGQKKQTKNFIYQIIEGRMQKDRPTIISAEKDLKELKGVFEDRLYTRLESGFITKIKKPDEEEFNLILEFLLMQNSIDLNIIDKESKMFFVKEFSNSIRSLLGAITKIKYYKDELLKANYVFSVIKNIFRDHFNHNSELTPEVIVKKVSIYYKISTKEIMGKTRKKEIVIARHIAIILMDNLLNMSSTEIGKFLNKDHTTILNALKKTKNKEVFSSIKLVLNQIKNEIYTRK